MQEANVEVTNKEVLFSVDDAYTVATCTHFTKRISNANPSDRTTQVKYVTSRRTVIKMEEIVEDFLDINQKIN